MKETRGLRTAYRIKDAIELGDSGHNEQHWGIQKRTIKDYSRIFFPEFNFKSDQSSTVLQTYISELRQRNGSVIGLDLLSYGYAFLDYPDLDGGISVALRDIRTKEEQKEARKRNQEVITGNLLKRDTWNRIALAGAELRPKRQQFDFIVSCGSGGVEDMSNKDRAHKPLFERAWSLLGEGGFLIWQIPIRYNSRFVNPQAFEWIDQMNALGHEFTIKRAIFDERRPILMARKAPVIEEARG